MQYESVKCWSSNPGLYCTQFVMFIYCPLQRSFSTPYIYKYYNEMMCSKVLNRPLGEGHLVIFQRAVVPYNVVIV